MLDGMTGTGWHSVCLEDVKSPDPVTMVLTPFRGFTEAFKQIFTPAVIRAILAEDRIRCEATWFERQQEMWV